LIFEGTTEKRGGELDVGSKGKGEITLSKKSVHGDRGKIKMFSRK